MQVKGNLAKEKLSFGSFSLVIKKMNNTRILYIILTKSFLNNEEQIFQYNISRAREFS